MADEKDSTIETAAEEVPSAGGGFSILKVVKIAAFLAIVVGVECVVAYFLFPSADALQARADAMNGQSSAGDDLPIEPDPISELAEPDKLEADMGEFHVASYQPLSNTTLNIDFSMYATVLIENESTFKQLMEDKEQRVRDRVITTIRSADVTDFTDAGLGHIKRKIAESINRTLGKNVVEDIIFSKFSWFEQ
jgi:flagellar FliL protein